MTGWEYIKSRKFIILLLLLCSIVHIIVLFVYGNETEPVWYATVLYLVLVAVIGCFDYLHLKKKYKILQDYDVNSDRRLQEQVGETAPIALQYCSIISGLQEKLKEEETIRCKREKELSDFYTLWVHQIKTPIAALQVLLQTDADNVYGMKGELFKIERYVDVVLNYLRMEDMNSDLLLKHYSLDSICKQAVKKYTPLFIQSKLSLKLEDLEHMVLTDEKWTVFVLEQILSNALKYTRKGGIRIYGEDSEEKGVAITRLIVEDTGIGICAEDLPRIYDRAFTGYNGRNDKKASGLGLYLCKMILQKLGHEISIQSQPGQGTTVTVTFYEDTSLGGNLTKL